MTFASGDTGFGLEMGPLCSQWQSERGEVLRDDGWVAIDRVSR